MQNKIILFDIDYTLWDVKVYRSLFYTAISKQFSLDEKKFKEEAEKLYRSHMDELKHFYPEIFAEKLISYFSLDTSLEDLQRIILDKEIFINAFYPNVEKTLKTLKERGYILAIFSRGRLSLQGMKLESIKSLFTEIHIFKEKHEKLEEVIGKYKKYKLFIVDDLPKILIQAKKISPDITAIWIKQGYVERNLKEVSEFSPDFTITYPEDLLPILH